MDPKHPQQEHKGAASAERKEGALLEQDTGSDYLITVQVEPDYEPKIDPDRLHRLAGAVLHAEHVEGPLELGVVVTTDAEVRRLNSQYLGHDYNTDVISFGMNDDDAEADEALARFITPTERPAYLGDIAISYDRASEQSYEYGHDAETEVALLLIHGLLHLVGYDDHEDEARLKMHARQQELLDTLFKPAP